MIKKILCPLAIVALFFAGFLPQAGVQAQSVLYPNQFDLQEVTLLDSPFQKAQLRNYQTLLEYDVDRILTPFIRQAGLSKTADEHNRYYNWEFEHMAFENWAWNPTMAMDGHLGGHYLSALSISYASCQDPVMKGKLKERIDYMVTVLCDCQKAYDKDESGLRGFIGGIPDNEVWKALFNGDFRIYNHRGNWVPLYCEHKIMAGLRDAYVYAGNAAAKEAFRRLCDWSIDIVKLFREDIMEMQILQWEPGGINEVLADAYKLFGDSKYLKAAQKYSHQIMIENMVRDDSHSFLDQKNANEAAAKFVGFARINELKSDARYGKASSLFWQDVVQNRINAIGGMGVQNFFVPVAKSGRYITDADGSDECATYNMLKLTERLFSSSRDARFSDYYERAMLNHILSSQDPLTGGYVFYTSMRPESYRIYSQVNEAMWCCVGTGMESQSKYGDFIYTMSEDTLFVNLFVASRLTSQRAALTQETSFPYGQTSRITIEKPGNYTLAVRRPEWATGQYSVKVNGKEPKGFKAERAESNSYYVSCGRGWKQGDVIEVSYPMSLSYVECPHVPTYIAMKYGPVVLAGVTDKSTQDKPFNNEYAGDGKHDNSNTSKQKFQSLAFAPMLITERSLVPGRVQMRDASALLFEVDATAPGSKWTKVLMKPFFASQHNRYTVYWNQQTETAWMRNPLYLRELRSFELEKVTYDICQVGEIGSERKHAIRTSETGSCGVYNDNTFRDCQPGQWFELAFKSDVADKNTVQGDSLTLLLRLSISDKGRKGTILVEGKPVRNIVIPSSVKNIGRDKFFEMPVNFSSDLVRGKDKVHVRFQSDGGFFPRVYRVRFMKNDKKLLSEL